LIPRNLIDCLRLTILQLYPVNTELPGFFTASNVLICHG